MFVVKLETLNDRDSDRALLLCMDSSGELRDIAGHEASLEELKSVMSQGKANHVCQIKLIIDCEEKTSLPTFGEVISLLRAASDPNKETTVFVHLKKLAIE
jgi:hypothetical protein